MARYYRKTRRYARKSRPSDRKIRAATTTLTSAGTTYTGYLYTADVPQTARGIRLDCGMRQDGGGAGIVAYALVVVREGYNTNDINFPAINDDLYNPTQDVLISGVLTEGSVEDHKFNMIGRKLRQGDRIALVLRGTMDTMSVGWELSFTALY